MSNRRGFILGISLLALGASSLHAQDVARKPDSRGNDSDWAYKDGSIYADDDFWYGDQQRVTNTRFRGMDRDNNGIITQSEWRGNTRSFRNQDWNNDGVLSGREVRRNAVRARNRNTRVEAVDRDRNGRIDRGEWMGSRNDFRRIDRDNDGYITATEARLRFR
jgi:hypothetical protein